MPRPKKAGAPQPKKRSRNGCWPCKSRKVKCDEAHPSCLNCQRQSETCDYSIRLNWGGRGKKKPEGNGQFVFSSSMDDSLGPGPSLANMKDSRNDIVSTTPSAAPDLLSTNDNDTRPSTATSEAPSQSYPIYSSPQRHANLLTQYQSQPSPLASVIDPTLIDNQGPAAGAYLQSQYQMFTQPDLTYSQSCERYNVGSTQRRAQQSAMSRVCIIPRRNAGQYLQFDKFQQKASTGPSFVDDMTVEDEGLGPEMNSIDRPFKRIKYNSQNRPERVGELIPEMPPPHMTSWSNGYGPYSVSQLTPTNQSPFGTPMTPSASSTHSDEPYRPLPARLSPYIAQNSPDFRRLSQDTSDPRRLSVESLLSGPPGIPDEPIQTCGSRLPSDAQTSHPYSVGSGEIVEEMVTYGVDRGFRDLDVGKNDDDNAISGGSPITKREHLDHSIDGQFEDQPVEFGFGVQAKDTAFEKNDYYAQPVTIKLPRSFEPLPRALLDNPMNLLYFHHFISHTARLLVPHHCSSNPFQKLLPRMAIEDQNLMNLLLAYSASHRARLLQQPEPATRIALWVKDVFPNLRQALKDPDNAVSNANLAAAIMLASLEIISPKAFGVSVSWQQYLLTARAMVLARGGVRSMYYDRSDVSHFLIQWFAYLDVLGSLVGGPPDPSSPTGDPQSPLDERTKIGWLGEYDFDDENDYRIDCLFGFTGRCITILAHIAELARACDIERIDGENNIRPEWKPSEEVAARAEKLITDLEAARTNTQVQPCPYLHSAGEAAYQWDTQEMAATNEAYHWAGLVHVHRRVLGKSSTHPDVQNAVREICGALYKVRKGSSAEFCLLFPIFTAGCDAQDEKQRATVMERFRGIEEFGMSQVHKARTLMQRVWDTGKPWETLVSGEFVG